MDFLERLEQLMRIKGINKAQLAAGAGLGKATVYAWWDKGYEGITLPKLRAICNYFGCTLDWLVDGDDEGSIYLSTDEQKLVSAYHAADPSIQAAVRKLLDLPETKENASTQSAG